LRSINDRDETSPFACRTHNDVEGSCARGDERRVPFEEANGEPRQSIDDADVVFDIKLASTNSFSSLRATSRMGEWL